MHSHTDRLEQSPRYLVVRPSSGKDVVVGSSAVYQRGGDGSQGGGAARRGEEQGSLSQEGSFGDVLQHDVLVLAAQDLQVQSALESVKSQRLHKGARGYDAQKAREP